MAKRKKRSKKSAGSLTLRQVSVLLKKKRQTLSKLETQKQLLEDKLDAVEAKMAAITASSAGGAKKAKLASARRGRPRKSSNAVTLASLIDQILAHAGRPMRIPEVADEALRCGYRTTSKQFRLLVRQTLNRTEHVKRTSRGRYVLTVAGKRAVAKNDS